MTKVFYMDFTDEQRVKSTIFYMTVSFIIYVVIYKLLRKKVNISPEYEIRLLTFFHGLFCSICALHYVMLPALGYYEGNFLKLIICVTYPTKNMSTLSDKIICVSLFNKRKKSVTQSFDTHKSITPCL